MKEKTTIVKSESLILKAYKFRIYPTKAQELRILDHCAKARWFWNYCLGALKKDKADWFDGIVANHMNLVAALPTEEKKIFEEIHCQKTNRKLPKNELKVLWRAEKTFRTKLSKDIKYVPKVYLSKAVEKLQVGEVSLQAKLPSLKEQSSVLKEVSSNTYLWVLDSLKKAMTSCFKSGFGFPKFKNSDSGQSFTDGMSGSGISADLKTSTISLVKIKDIPTIFHNDKFINDLQNKRLHITKATISKNTLGEYYISLSVETDQAYPILLPVSSNNTILLSEIATLHGLVSKSDRNSNSGREDRLEKRLKLLSRSLTRKRDQSSMNIEKYGSLYKKSNYEKARKKRARIEVSLARIREDHYHRVSTSIVADSFTNAYILEEDQWQSTKKTKDIAFGKFLTFLTYKARSMGKTLIYVGLYNLDSFSCGKCGEDIKSLQYSKNSNILKCSCTLKKDLASKEANCRQSESQDSKDTAEVNYTLGENASSQTTSLNQETTNPIVL